MVTSSSAVLVAAAGGTAALALGDDGDALTSASHTQRQAAEGGDSSQFDPAQKTEESVGGSDRVLSQVADQLGGFGGSRKLEGSQRLDLGLLGQNKSSRRGLFGNKLFGGNRRLQSAGGEVEEAEVEMADLVGDGATCSYPETCEPSFCECQAAGKDIMQCASVLDALCKGQVEEDGKTFKLSGCVNPEKYEYFQTYCDFATCALAGGTYASCECEWYGVFCDRLEGHPNWAASEDRLESCQKKGCCFDNNGDIDVTQCYPVVEEDEDTPTEAESEVKEDEEGAVVDNTAPVSPTPVKTPNSARRKEYGGAIAVTAFVGWLLSFLL
mmetsp:Transcript_21291/g.49994  ORF Transcript_21291/g.49994 Transcript_21291/m.49994 type:complete len:326 (-) Transcript_21291:203-1180(-)